ncbi:MAG TPA: PA14 domain-containing protein, partial [Candidatus Saccharimonadales bacterium]|nr:PA14 domain-containing protein [Candidatus Saccharimonadales bacterium]
MMKQIGSRLPLKNSAKFNKLAAAGLAAVLVAIGVFVVIVTRAASYDTFLPVTETAKPADSFARSFGVNTHLEFTNTPYYTNYPAIRQALQELGVSYVRTGLGDHQAETIKARLKDLAGIGILPIVGGGNPTNTEAQRQTTIRHLADLKAANVLAGIEGPNEWDLNGGDNWIPEIQAFTQDLWRRVQANPILKNSTVLGPTYKYSVADDVGDLSAYVTHNNIHSYPSAKPPTDHQYYLNLAIQGAQQTAPGKPVLLTEWGYHNALKYDSVRFGHAASSERAAGIYGPRQALFHFANNIAASFSYELLDEVREGDPIADREASFGLVRSDFSRKPIFTALKNLIALTKDPGPAFTPTTLNYRLDGAAANTRHLLLQTRDGSYWLAVWQETLAWDREARTDLNPPNTPMKLVLGSSASSLTTYMPNRGTAPLQRQTNASALEFESSEEVSLIEIRGVGANSPLPPSTASQGLLATYYNSTNFTGSSITRVDPTINFDWGTGSPHPTIRSNYFSARWTGKIKAPTSGTYGLHTMVDSGVRLYLNGKLVIDNYVEQNLTTRSTTVNLTAGQSYDIKMEYFEWHSAAAAKLLWTTPGSTQAVIIPTSQLLPPGATDSTPPPPSPADTTRPTTAITAPTSGAQVSGTTTVSATASDNIGVSKVEFLVDGALKATDTTSPYSFSWDTKTTTNGSRSLTTKAYDAAGNTTTSTAITVTVANTTATTPPPPPPSTSRVPVCAYYSQTD